MAPILDIDLTVTPSVEEVQVNNNELPINNFDLNVDLDLDLEDRVLQHANEEISSDEINLNGQPLFDLNMSPLHEGDINDDIGEEEILDDISQGEIEAKKKNVNLSNEQRRAIYDALLENSVNGKLKRDTTSIVASLFLVSIQTVQRIWKQLKTSFLGGFVDVSHKRTKNCGRKRVQIDVARFREIPLARRTTLDSLACSLKINKTSLFRLLKSGVIWRHSNSIRPFLKEDNMKARLQFCMLDKSSTPHDPMFVDMDNIIHIDEKWFYMTKRAKKYYLLSDEEDPLRTCKSKNFIGQVMFLVTIARPRFDAQGNELFSEKIGVFPFVTQEHAKRTSANRVAGTLETKLIPSIDKHVTRLFLIEKILPAIRAKWPSEDVKSPIFIQQDNAKTHVDPMDEKFCQAASQHGFDIRLMYQPANSPDLNVLDLGFFSAIQSLQHKESPSNIDELIGAF